jgi:hypothetical protein
MATAQALDADVVPLNAAWRVRDDRGVQWLLEHRKPSQPRHTPCASWPTLRGSPILTRHAAGRIPLDAEAGAGGRCVMTAASRRPASISCMM